MEAVRLIPEQMADTAESNTVVAARDAHRLHRGTPLLSVELSTSSKDMRMASGEPPVVSMISFRPSSRVRVGAAGLLASGSVDQVAAASAVSPEDPGAGFGASHGPALVSDAVRANVLSPHD